jgi:hypothetical protein
MSKSFINDVKEGEKVVGQVVGSVLKTADILYPQLDV